MKIRCVLKRGWKTGVLGLTWAAAALLTVSVGSSEGASKIRIGNPVPKPALATSVVYVARDAGFFAKEGLDVSMQGFFGGVKALQGAVAGAVDIADTSGEQAILAHVRKSGMKAFYTYANKLDSTLTVQADIRSPQDLRGRKIGIQDIGGFSEVQSRFVMVQAGLNPKDVQYISIPPPARVPSLLAGKVDTVIIHIDESLAAMKKDPKVHNLARLWEIVPNYLFTAFVAPGKMIQGDPKRLVAFTKAMIATTRFMYENKDKTIEIAGKYTGWDKDVLSRAYDFLVAGKIWTTDPGLPRDVVGFTVEKMKELNLLKPNESPRYEDLVDRSIGQRAMAALGS